MIEFLKKLLSIFEFKPLECVLPDGKKVYIVIGGEPVNTIIFEEDQMNESESKK
jgi:hypothetical protein